MNISEVCIRRPVMTTLITASLIVFGIFGYRLLAVVNEPEHVFVILCDCLWPQREAWRPQFRALIGSFQLKSGKALN